MRRKARVAHWLRLREGAQRNQALHADQKLVPELRRQNQSFPLTRSLAIHYKREWNGKVDPI